MGAAYTPGLTVSADTVIRKTRRLPLKGSVLVAVGERVLPDTVVARAELPGLMQTLKVAGALGIDPDDVPGVLLAQVGDHIEKAQVIARTPGVWGMFRQEYKASSGGTVELVSSITGNVGVRGAATPVEVTAYLPGIVAEVLPNEGIVVEARGAFIQGIFGVGGERRAPLCCVSASPHMPLADTDITPEHAGKLIVGGSSVSEAALRRAAEVGVAGIIAGGIIDSDLIAYLGHDIGVAITGHEDIPLTLLITEGFGTIAMADRTFALLQSLEGREASFSGATQIRAGVIRPEIFVAAEDGNTYSAATKVASEEDYSLAIGTPIRIIREPYFGMLATVTALPPELRIIASGAEVRVLEAALNISGDSVIVPRANVELML